MIFFGATSGAYCRLAADYEHLRSGVLAGATGAHFGLVILLREGVAAWMAGGAARAAKGTPGSAKDPQVSEPIVSDRVHTEMVAVLASMVMATPGERCA